MCAHKVNITYSSLFELLWICSFFIHIAVFVVNSKLLFCYYIRKLCEFSLVFIVPFWHQMQQHRDGRWRAQAKSPLNRHHSFPKEEVTFLPAEALIAGACFYGQTPIVGRYQPTKRKMQDRMTECCSVSSKVLLLSMNSLTLCLIRTRMFLRLIWMVLWQSKQSLCNRDCRDTANGRCESHTVPKSHTKLLQPLLN